MSDDRMKAMKMEGPEYIPVTVGILPAAWMKHREKIDAIVKAHPIIFGSQDGSRDYDKIWGETYSEGEHEDVAHQPHVVGDVLRQAIGRPRHVGPGQRRLPALQFPPPPR